MRGMEKNYERLKGLIQKGDKVVFLGGAGVSTGSGIPDFRGQDGLYKMKEEYGVSYETMLSASYFYAHPDTFYSFYWRKMVYPEAKPSKAHIALAEYERKGGDITILTQNIDGLHQKAGSHKVIELHGTTLSYHCLKCHKKYALSDLKYGVTPYCSCGGLIKPDVTLYEEALDEKAIYEAIESLQKADILIVGGTSLRVYPAAGLIQYFAGRKSVIINKEATPLDSFFDERVHEDVGEVLSFSL